MQTLDRLKAMQPNLLVLLCRRMAEDRNIKSEMRIRARVLIVVWASLQIRGQQPTFCEKTKVEQEMNDLKASMAELLVTV